MRRWMWVVLGLVILGGGVYGWRVINGPASTAQQAVAQERMYVPVTRSTITRTLTYSGSLEPVRDVTLTAGSAGWIKELLVKKGDRVRAGDVIARLDDTEAQLEVIRARREYEQARLESPAGVVEERRLALAAAERRLNATAVVAPFDGLIVDVFVEEGDSVGAQTQIARLIDTSRYKVTVPVDQKDLAHVAVGQSVYVRPDALSGLVLVGRIEEIGFLPSSMDSTTSYPVVIALDVPQAGGRGSEAAAPEAAVSEAGASEEAAYAAAASGVAVSETAAPEAAASQTAASQTAGGQGAGRLGGRVGVAAAIPTRMAAGRMAPGATPGFPGARRLGTPAPGDPVEVARRASELRPGMTVEAEIVVASAENVLVVPIASIVESGGRQLVTRVNADGTEEVVEIETGLTDGLYVEVRSGLNEGDRIVANNYALFEQIGGATGTGERAGFGIPVGAPPVTRVFIGR